MAKEEKHIAKRIGPGQWFYRGFLIESVGYYHPEHRVCWEAVGDDGCAFGHDYTLRDCKKWVDIAIREKWGMTPIRDLNRFLDKGPACYMTGN